jgi:UDP-N-acetylmuramoyl-tripeptide--D-alanyl-D-alanine ligase
LRGENFNANEFASDAVNKGARLAIIDEERYAPDDNFLLVPDVLTTLQALAKHHREQHSIPVIGLTGSNGKTTTKELLAAVLSTKFKTHVTKGNLNNHIGVPLTILQLQDSTEIAVIEMGANHLGEIAFLCSIANPTHGLITNIGKAHIGTFGGFENIIRGKSELYQHLIANHGQVFINSNDQVLSNMAKRFTDPIFYPAKNDFYSCSLIRAEPYLEVLTDDGSTIQTQLIGKYNFENIAAALCVGKFFDITPSEANDAIRNYVPGNKRSEIVDKGTNTIVLDAYNANPSSMSAALDSLHSMSGKKKVVILGDMFELENEAENEHRELGKNLDNNKIDEILLCGKLMAFASEENVKAKHFENKDDLIAYLKENKPTESVILVKGSRGMQLEKIVDFL